MVLGSIYVRITSQCEYAPRHAERRDAALQARKLRRGCGPEETERPRRHASDRRRKEVQKLPKVSTFEIISFHSICMKIMISEGHFLLLSEFTFGDDL